MADAELRVITGPTAAGKSSLALALAVRHGAALVSADSRQIYTGFDIGTAKPTRAERAAVPHYGIDIVEPTQRYSAAAWGESASAWIAESLSRDRVPLVVGGTGFYLRALFAPLFEEPPLDQAARAQLQDYLATLSTAELRRWCDALDPVRAALGRTQLLRAIEVAILTGTRLSELHARSARPARWRARYLVVDPGAVLGGWIEQRVDAMIARGWEEEVRGLIEHVPADAPAWNAAGYEAMRDVALGHSTATQAREQVVIETRRYAKRQRTWFRHQLEAAHVTMVDPTRRDALAEAERWWRGESA